MLDRELNLKELDLRNLELLGTPKCILGVMNLILKMEKMNLDVLLNNGEMSIVEKITDDNRAFASFGGKCPFKCSHCYTFSKNFEEQPKYSIDEIVENLNNEKDFNPTCQIYPIKRLIFYKF